MHAQMMMTTNGRCDIVLGFDGWMSDRGRLLGEALDGKRLCGANAEKGGRGQATLWHRMWTLAELQLAIPGFDAGAHLIVIRSEAQPSSGVQDPGRMASQIETTYGECALKPGRPPDCFAGAKRRGGALQLVTPLGGCRSGACAHGRGGTRMHAHAAGISRVHSPGASPPSPATRTRISSTRRPVR